MSVDKQLWGIVLACVVPAVYFMPPPRPGQGKLDYVLNGEVSWSSALVIAFQVVCLLLLILRRLERDHQERYHQERYQFIPDGLSGKRMPLSDRGD